MAFPSSINFDFVIYQVLFDIKEATKGWLGGQPKSEEALMNRITERLGRNRKKNCDVGVNFPVYAELEHIILHREGSNNTDLFGSDIAITVNIPSDSFTKTCLMQIKKSENYSATIERRQIEQASVNPSIKSRSFVLIVDDPRGGVKVRSISEVNSEFPKNQLTHQMNCTNWESLSNWVWQWLSCEKGAGNTADDPPPIEPLLKSQIKGTSRNLLDNRIDLDFDLPDKYKLAKVWFRINFKKSIE